MPKISTIAITFNEEANIERCLRSVMPFSDEILVVDSRSTDRTVEIARSCGARVISNDWPGYGKQKQFALESAVHPWVLSIDADEEVSPGLCEEIKGLDFTENGYEMPRSVWYLNRWVKHGVWYPGYVLRLFRRDKADFTADIVHESARVTGSVGRLKNDLLHYTYRDMSHHIEKMNKFTSLGAKQMFDEKRRVGVHQLTVFPFLEFLKVYVSKRGFLDGLAGFAIAILHAFYVFLKYAKLFEMHVGSRRSAVQGDDSDTSHVEAGR